MFFVVVIVHIISYMNNSNYKNKNRTKNSRSETSYIYMNDAT